MNRHDCRRDIHIYLSWPANSKAGGAVAYRTDTHELVFPLIDYSLYLLDDERLDMKTVKNEIGRVKRLLEYLWSRSKDIVDLTDQVIEKFRDEEVEKVSRSPNRSKSMAAHKRTVNAKLRRIYHFLSWLQEVDKSQLGMMAAEGARVTSTFSITDRAHRGPTRLRSSRRTDFPKTILRVGEGSKHRSAYCATDEDIENLQAYFTATSSPKIARRNILMMDLGEETGMRRGSVNSLRCAQFTEEIIESLDEFWEVTPDVQKFGYEKSYRIPMRLAMRVLSYIENEREEMIFAGRWSKKNTQDRIFLSARTGRPLQDQSVSQMFGDAFRVLKPTVRAAYHCLRHKFGNDSIDNELVARVELGLDTSVQSIASSVSLSMGQESYASLEPYVSRQVGRYRGGTKTTADRMTELERENRDLRREIDELKRKLSK
ncbi:site-specific integrase [Burkholderia seminalis]|uniref:hypothetical protein n=1 Tax=Burkholderia seminalis TaxID=488731 RepID=UPI001CF24599|nr:hypothetical protein [Burkholderia seminalis]MCA8041835.1 hypothetical protein [Burkholderia seminalis]